MKIGLANNLYPPHGRDSGAEIITKKMADDLQKNGHQVFVITTTPNKVKREDTDNVYHLSSSYENLAKFNNLQKLFWHFNQLIFPSHKKILKAIIEKEKPDLFITHNLLGLSWALPKILTQTKTTHHHVLHDIQLLHPSGLMYWGEEKKIKSLLALIYQSLLKKRIKKIDKIISPSQWLLRCHKERDFFLNQETEVKTNFNFKKITPKIQKKPCRFLFAGQLEKHKGLKLLISAWKKSDLNKEEAILSIAGSGSLVNFIEESIRKISNLKYLGHLNREAMQIALENSDIIILPSLVYENSPTILWEAAQNGLSAIASNIGGIPEIKPYLSMQVFEPGNTEELVKLIKKTI